MIDVSTGIALSADQSLENNFTLAVVVFIVGFIATLVTTVVVIYAHRYWEKHDADLSFLDERGSIHE